jgi:hypothetical protein
MNSSKLNSAYDALLRNADKFDWKKFSELPCQILKSEPCDKINWTKLSFNPTYTTSSISTRSLNKKGG